MGVGNGGVIVRRDETGWNKDQLASSSGTGSLYGIYGSSATDVWAVGNGVMQHFDGTSWSQIAPPNIDLPYDGVWLSGPGEGWAVGLEGIIAHLHDGVWSDAGRPRGGDVTRCAIWGSAANDVWAVGGISGQTISAQIDHFDGTSWTSVSSSLKNIPLLSAIWGSDANHVWAVGDGGTMLFFNGSLWKPILSGTTEDLHAI